MHEIAHQELCSSTPAEDDPGNISWLGIKNMPVWACCTRLAVTANCFLLFSRAKLQTQQVINQNMTCDRYLACAGTASCMHRREGSSAVIMTSTVVVCDVGVSGALS